MAASSQQTASVWMQTETIPFSAALPADTQADVCVIGAGIAGMTTAYLLLQEGKSVVVLDDGPVGGGQTQRTTAHLSNALDDRYVEIERWHGQEGARLAAESHSAAIDRIEAVVAQEKIACDFERLDGFLFAPPGESGDLLEHELQAARRAGLANVELLPRAPLTAFDTGPCLRFPGQAQFHPLKYLAGLTKAILGRGGRIFTQAHADEIKRGFPVHIQTRQGPTVTASAVVVATNTPFNDLVAIHTKQAAYMSYVVAFGVPRNSVAKALYWDTLDPYHYVRLQALHPADPAGQQLGDPQTEELLIVGGEDHKTGQADDAENRYRRLEAWTRERFAVQGTVRCRWSGQVLETIDGLAFIGRNPIDAANVFVATGDSGMGMTHGTIAGILLTDLIVGRRNPWAALYDPARKTVGAAATFLQENLNVARQYGAWLTGGDLSSTAEIFPGQGAVVRQGLTKVAAFCDEQGILHEFSALCPHLGCLVEWNHNESTWDCPCHGSRFDKQGCVLNGPANTDLAPVCEA
jgi:glycine/D-amino acid oxidase-like deaminating enzyme/nitrite reductase/ring-hydroxylating ferredoxin subunit